MPPMTIALLGLLGERPPWRVWIGVGVALAGTVVFLLDKLDSPDRLAGDVLSLGSAISFAAYDLLNRQLVARYPTSTYTAYTLLAGSVPLLGVSLPSGLVQDWHALSLPSWLIVAYMIALPVYVAYMVWNWGIVRIGAAAASSFAVLTPVIAGVFSVLFLGEAFDARKLIGAALVLTGLVALQRNSRPLGL